MAWAEQSPSSRAGGHGVLVDPPIAAASVHVTPHTASPTGLTAIALLAQQGDEQATAELMETVHRLGRRYAAARLAGFGLARDRVEDVAQDVCVAVLQALPRFENQGAPFEAFVYSISSRKVADAQRSLSRGAILSDELPESPDSGSGPEDVAVGVDTARRLAHLMDGLTLKHREILTLRVGVGLSAEETARTLGMSAGAVRVAQHRALTKLREMHDRSGEELR